MNKISVIMSVYNTNEKWLRESIESILNQTYKDFEFIIVLDAPTDNSEFIVQEYARIDKRIIIIKNEINLGLTKSLNIAIEKATGMYIARMDSDDISNTKRFEKQIQYLDTNQDVIVVGSYVIAFDENNNYCSGTDNISQNNEMNKIRMLFYNAGIVHSTAMIRRNFLLEKHIFYDESIKKSQDYALWTDILFNEGKISIIKEILLEYRMHSGQITQQCSDEQIECVKRTMNKQINYYFSFNPTINELDINFNFYSKYQLIEKNNTEKYLNKLIKENKKLNNALLKKEIYSIWLYDMVAKAIKYKDVSFVFSKLTLKAFRLKYIYYILQKRKLNNLYKEKVNKYCKDK